MVEVLCNSRDTTQNSVQWVIIRFLNGSKGNSEVVSKMGGTHDRYKSRVQLLWFPLGPLIPVQ